MIYPRIGSRWHYVICPEFTIAPPVPRLAITQQYHMSENLIDITPAKRASETRKNQ